MITILVDHNIEWHADLLQGLLGAAGWLDLAQIRFLRFAEVGLPINSTDQEVWRFAQANSMFLLTGNRNMKSDDSLEMTIRNKNSPASLPVITIGDADRLADRTYREKCAERFLEIVLYLESCLGTGRLFIP